MTRNRFLPLVVAIVVAFLVSLTGAGIGSHAVAEDGKGAKKARPRGPTYRNKSLGVRTSGPAGWRMVADKLSAVSSWKRLATFNDRATDAQVVLYTRPRASSDLDALMASVRKEWQKSAGRLRMDAARKVDASPLTPIGKIIVDGSFSRKAKVKKAKDGIPPPPVPDTPMRVQATYYLGPGHAYLMYATVRQTHWSRMRKGLSKMRDELSFDQAVDAGPTGAGSYRNERVGFACRYPKAYTVVQPQRVSHIVKFVGLSANDPAISVYAFRWDKSAGDDADRLRTYYTDDKAGEVSTHNVEVSGTEGIEVQAKATIDGVDRVYRIAVVKRGEDCFRLRVSVPAEAEASGAAAFRKFLAGFQFGTASKPKKDDK